MKSAFALISAALLPFCFQPQASKPDPGLPQLHTIRTATLSPAYSCRSHEEFRRGYDRTALFLSRYSDEINSPDLVFNGACGSEDSFEAATAGDDMSVIADLGSVPLEQVTAHRAFNFKSVHSWDLYSRFTREARVQAGHTYAVLINKHDVRGLVIVSVTGYVPNKKVDLQYAVKEYQLLSVKSEAEGFDWSAVNQGECPQR